MGARGPAPRPSALRQVEGDRRAGEGTPQPESRDVRKPDLSDDAGAVWDRLAPDLIRQRLLTYWDVDSFTAYCDAVAQRDRAQHHLDTEGEVVMEPVFDRNGVVTGERHKRSHWHMVWVDANALMLRLSQRFGFTPADRAGLKVDSGSSGQDKRRLLSS